MFKQAASYHAMNGLSNGQMKAVFDLRITGVEMPPAAKYDELREIGFTIATIVGHQSLEDGLNKSENRSRIADEIRANLETAKQYEIPSLICLSGNRNGKSDEEGLENCITVLGDVAKDAESSGVNLIVELLNSKVDHPDYQCDNAPFGVKVVEGVNSPRVKLLYDIYHMQIMEGDLIRTIRDNHQHFAHYHTAGNPGRKDLDAQQEIYYPAVARAIAETGFDGWLGHEFSPKGDAVAALKQAYEQCSVS
jgi:hydroxypyruvate isomerase